MRTSIFLIVGILTIVGCSSGEKRFETLPANQVGIDFQNTLTETDDLNILDYLYFYNGGGVAVGDINGDQLADVFLSGNQVQNKLYLNKGDFQFEDITAQAGVGGDSSWNTGAVMGDVNGDGLLDIYVCAVVGINGFYGHNELYINLGDGKFEEQSKAYGLNFKTFSSNAAFLDYDLDGDLDIYLLNHAVHTQHSFGKASLRKKRNETTGDKLLRNDGGIFTEVSEEAGIFGGINSYGLGISIADFNLDGWPDVYIGNDFHEDDYFYLNNQDGTFTESLKDYFGHTSRFSMGNDTADLNHDGFPDLISLDMLPNDEIALKSSEGDDNIQTQKLRIEKFGYHYQFTRNMLYLNTPNYQFKETGLYSGIAATDWSWSALFADFDNDTEQDLFISNGIPKRPNNLDYINFLSNDNIQRKMNNTKLVDQKALELMPSGKVTNVVFQGKTNLQFENKTGQWMTDIPTVSGATALADFDNDGDVDINTNNLNEAPTFYKNTTNTSSTYLKIQVVHKDTKTPAVGAKVLVYNKGKLQSKTLYTVRGFQASSEPVLHFGLAQEIKVDSIRVIWPDNSTQLYTEVASNQNLTLEKNTTQSYEYAFAKAQPKLQPLFSKVPGNLGIDFTHKEDAYLDFNRQKLIPYQASDRGPAFAKGDLNNDGKEDLYFGGSKFELAQIFLQSNLTDDTLNYAFAKAKTSILFKEKITEDVSAVIADFTGNEKNDLLIGTGGADFYNKAKALKNVFYARQDTTWTRQDLPEDYGNAAVILPVDFDQDGDLDVFVGNHIVTNNFGEIPTSFILKNNQGVFTKDPELIWNDLGMITDAIWDDFNGDGTPDLIIVGEWMAPVFLENIDKNLSKTNIVPSRMRGLWQSVVSFDIDHDGDQDYMLGNWGLNSKFTATAEYPMQMYLNDYDQNGQSESLIATYKNDAYFCINGLDELAAQWPRIRKKFSSYEAFAGKSISEILSKDQIKNSTLLSVDNLQSGYLKNEAGTFTFVPFPWDLQLAPITDFLVHDFNNDGTNEVLVAGNYFGVKPYHGRLDTFSGAMIKDEQTIIDAATLGLDFSQKSLRHMETIDIDQRSYLLAVFNNDRIQVYNIHKDR